MPVIHQNTQSGIEAIESKLTLNDEQFEAIAKKAEEKANTDYKAYKQELVIWALAGCVYIGTILALLIALLIFLVLCVHNYLGWKLILILSIFILVVCKALWVKFPEPTGIELEREKFPKLFSLIDEICQRSNTRADVVLLDTDFNASVSQVPKAGVFGMSKNFLSLGLTYMLAEDEPGFKATLAHEFGHLSGKHSETQRWIYNLYKRWAQLRTNLERSNILFQPFIAWYMPRFHAKSMVMNRRHEIEADQTAIEFAGPEANSSSLVLMAIKGRFLHEEIWNSIYKGAISSNEPPNNVYSQIMNRFNEIPKGKLKVWFEEALKQEEDKTETHPSLKNRLMLGDQLAVYEKATEELLEKVVRPLKPGESSAEIYLGDELPNLIESLNTEWCTSLKEPWQAKFEEYEQCRVNLGRLDDKESELPLSVEELKEKAYYLNELDRETEAAETYKRVLQIEPNDAVANISIGAYLVNNKVTVEDSAKVLGYLEKSAKHDIRNIRTAKLLSIQHLIDSDRQEEIEKLFSDNDEIELAVKERNSVKESDEFFAHGLSETRVKELHDWAQEVKDIKSFCIVQKKMQHFPDSKHYIIGVDVNGDDENKNHIARMILECVNNLPGTLSVVAFDMWTMGLEKKIRKTPQSLIYIR